VADRVSSFTITFDGEAGTVKSVLAALKSQIKGDVADIQATADRLDLFKNLQQQAKDASTAFFTTKQRVEDLRTAIDAIRNAGGVVGAELAKSLKDAERAAASARKEFDTDLIKAQDQLKAKISELRSSVTSVGTAATTVGPQLTSVFQSALVPVLGFAAAAGAVGTAIHAAIDAAREYEQRLADIGATTNLSKVQLEGLGDAARSVSRELGVDMSQALVGVKDLLRSGVPEDNVIGVIRVAAEASIASTEDLATAVKAASLLIDAFGTDVKDLKPAFDVIITGAHNGGATLKEFAENAGPLLNVARALGVPLQQVVALLTVVTDKTNNAADSAALLTKVFARFDTAAVREQLRNLGLEGKSILEVFDALGKRGLRLEDFLQLGLVSQKSAAGLAAITNNAGELAPTLERLQQAAGATDQALQRQQETYAQRQRLFHAEVGALAETLGESFGAGSAFAALLTRIAANYNDTFDAARAARKAYDESGGSIVAAIKAYSAFSPQAARAAEKQREVAAAAEAAGKAVDTSAKQIEDATKSLGDVSSDLGKAITALQALSSQGVADIDARAAAEIAALDRTRNAYADTAAAQTAIETQANADRLAVIERTQADVAKAIDKFRAARLEQARREGKDEESIRAEVQQFELGVQRGQLQSYQRYYDGLVQQAQRYASQLQTIEQARVDVNRTIEAAIRDIRFQALSGLDQFVARNAEIDRLISEGRAAAARGDVQVAKDYFQQATQEAKGFGKVIDENGNEVVTSLQAQTGKLEALGRISKANNESLGAQGDIAKASLTKTKEQIEAVLPALDEMRNRVDSLKANLEHGLFVKIQKDQASIDSALATLDDLAKDRTVTLHVRTVNDDGTPAPGGLPGSSSGGGNGEHFATGGIVGGSRPMQPVRGFARGGAVFHSPAWSKVPGIGNGDSVPALLSSGSFVVRKSASQFYGDSLMGQLAGVRHYAAGGSVFGMNDRSNGTGTVTKADIQQYAETKWGFDPFSSKVYDPGNIGSAPGRTGTTAPETDPNKGFRSGDTFQDKFTQRVISLDTRPIPEQFITAVNVVAYAKEMLNSVGQNNPLLGSLGTAVLQGIQTVSSNPNNSTALASLLQAAETIGANPYLFAMWGKTAGSPAAAQVQPEWFLDWLADRGLVDPSGAPTGTNGGLQSSTSGLTGQPGSLLGQNPLARSTRNFGVDIANRLLHPVGNLIPAAANNFGVKFFQTAIPAAGAPPIAAQRAQLRIDDLRTRFARPFAEGGGSTDTVPAMLTPGEFVVNKPAVDRIGAPLLWAINEMKLPKADLSYLLEAPRVARFATGGPVGVTAGATIMPTSSPVGTAAPTTININASAEDLFSAANIRRYFIPVWDDIQRRSRR
jgi:TP901 family phage tail tape measure protein